MILSKRHGTLKQYDLHSSLTAIPDHRNGRGMPVPAEEPAGRSTMMVIERMLYWQGMESE